MLRLSIALCFLLSSGCYLSHRREVDGGGDATTRCGAASCRLSPPREVQIHVVPELPVLPMRFEALALGVDPGGDGGLSIPIDTCGGMGCLRTLVIDGVGSDLADPAVLSGPVEVSWRDTVLVVRGDPCPGCDDGGVTAQLFLAVARGGAIEGFDLPLREVTVEAADMPCMARGSGAESSGRYRLSFTYRSTSFVLDEGETRGIGGDYQARVVGSSFECITPDLPPPRPLDVSSFVVFSIGPR